MIVRIIVYDAKVNYNNHKELAAVVNGAFGQ